MKKKGPKRATSKHPYLSGNFAPVTKTWPPTPVSWTGDVPKELHGGMYVRNGGNPLSNSDHDREAHWFDGDGMLSGVWFDITSHEPSLYFVNQFVLTDVLLATYDNESLRTPILPSIATLVNPLSRLITILWGILRTMLIIILSHLPGSQHAIKKISVANTAVLYHDGRALATCESGPPIRVILPKLETVGWYDGNRVEGETPVKEESTGLTEKEPVFGGTGLLSSMRQWTTGHPKVDIRTGEMMLFHSSFIPPYVHYSLLPSTRHATKPNIGGQRKMLSTPIPGCSGGKMMHDFGVSQQHTVILDLPLSLTPFNLVKNKPMVVYEPEYLSRFGVFPRHNPASIHWFETDACCIFHTANTWDELDSGGQVKAVNLLACRLTSASLVYSAGNMAPPRPNPKRSTEKSKKISFVGHKLPDPENGPPDETQPLLYKNDTAFGAKGITSSVSMCDDEVEQCRLYYYCFSMSPTEPGTIIRQFALSAIPFEFPTVSPRTEMQFARYIYGCSTTIGSFGAALGKGTLIDVIVKIDIKTLLEHSKASPPRSITGCVDERDLQEVLSSRDPNDAIKVFKLPPRHFAQEARFVPRGWGCGSDSSSYPEDDGYLLFYVFDESQLDVNGECRDDAKSELWVLDAKSMEQLVCKINLPTRVPYGLHGNWFTEEQIREQRSVNCVRSIPERGEETIWKRVRRRLVSSLG